MPRAGQPPASTLRNRNRITNKTRLKIIHGNIDEDPIIPDEDEEKNRLLQSVAGVDQEDANVCLIRIFSSFWRRLFLSCVSWHSEFSRPRIAY